MSQHPPDTTDESPDRYASLEIGDDDIVIYDREQPSAWLQSDHKVEPVA